MSCELWVVGFVGLVGTRGFIVILSDSEGSMNRNLRFEAYLKCFT